MVDRLTRVRTCARSGAIAAMGAGLWLAAAGVRGEVRREVPRSGTLPAGVRSIVMTDESAITIMAQPTFEGAIAGRALPGALLPVFEARNGRGCRRLWLRVAENAWVCGDHGELSDAEPVGSREGQPRAGEVLPWSYAFASHDGTRAYRTLAAALRASSDPSDYEIWEANWGFATVGTTGEGASRVVRTYGGFFLRRSDLYRATPSEFAGGRFEDLAGTDPMVPFGWVALGGSRVYPAPSEHGAGEPIARLSLVHVYATREAGGRVWARIGPERWIRADHVRWIAPAPPPEDVDVRARERWIDVDLGSQTLIAYEGADPVYATMVSTGRGQFATRPGVFRIHSRYLAHTMDNTEATHLPNHYRLGDVPYVQYFDGDRGLHAVYWHDGFGVPRSHGCVNLAPRDALYLWRWTAHPLPQGWVSMNIPPGAGTLVRIRGRAPVE